MAIGTAVYPGGSNTYVKDHRATGNLVVSFSRNAKDFPFNRYIQMRKVDKDAGYYLKITPENAARVVGSNINEFVWPDGADAPRRNSGLEKFAFADYKTERLAPDFTIGDKAREQAGWEIQGLETAFHEQPAMTLRGIRIASTLETTGNWSASHILDVDDGTTDVPGNTDSWELSTTQRQDIKRSLNRGVTLIHQHTLGAVKRKDMVLVMNPNTAERLGESQEVIDFIKQAPDSWKILKGEYENLNSQWGMPDQLYGVPIVIDDTVVVSTARGATTTTYGYTISDGNAFLVSRPGGLVSNAVRGPSFSTVMGFFYEEMTVEVKQDVDNRRLNGRVVDDYSIVPTAFVSGIFFRNCIE